MPTKTSDLKTLTVAQLRSLAKKKSISLTGITKKADIVAALSKSPRKTSSPNKKKTSPKKKAPAKTSSTPKIKHLTGWSLTNQKISNVVLDHLVYHGPNSLELSFLLNSLTNLEISLADGKEIYSVILKAKDQEIYIFSDGKFLKFNVEISKTRFPTNITVKYDKSFDAVIDELAGVLISNNTAKVVIRGT